MDRMIGFGLYQSCGNMVSVGRVSVFGLRCCGCGRWIVGGGVLCQVMEGWMVLYLSKG